MSEKFEHIVQSQGWACVAVGYMWNLIGRQEKNTEF